MEDFTTFATAPNPIYRLLAIRVIQKSLPDGVSQPSPDGDDELSLSIQRARLIALDDYTQESDPAIAEQLIGAISSIRMQESRVVLEAIRKVQSDIGNSQLVDMAIKSMKTLD